MRENPPRKLHAQGRRAPRSPWHWDRPCLLMSTPVRATKSRQSDILYWKYRPKLPDNCYNFDSGSQIDMEKEPRRTSGGGPTRAEPSGHFSSATAPNWRPYSATGANTRIVVCNTGAARATAHPASASFEFLRFGERQRCARSSFRKRQTCFCLAWP